MAKNTLDWRQVHPSWTVRQISVTTSTGSRWEPEERRYRVRFDSGASNEEVGRYSLPHERLAKLVAEHPAPAEWWDDEDDPTSSEP